MKIEFNVWENGQGEIHITSEDKRLDKGINIHVKNKLISAALLRKAIYTEAKNKREEQERATSYEDHKEDLNKWGAPITKLSTEEKNYRYQWMMAHTTTWTPEEYRAYLLNVVYPNIEYRLAYEKIFDPFMATISKTENLLLAKFVKSHPVWEKEKLTIEEWLKRNHPQQYQEWTGDQEKK